MKLNAVWALSALVRWSLAEHWIWTSGISVTGPKPIIMQAG